jgi:hypothetical protein
MVSHTLRPLLMCCAFPSKFWSLLIHLSGDSQLSGSNQQKHLREKQENLAKNCRQIWPTSISLILQRFLTCRKIVRHGVSAYLPYEGSRAIKFIALENPSSSTEIESAKLGSSGKHYNH